MGLRCELFGHEFSDSMIKESYKDGEQGTVLTVREYKSCKRCEHVRDISENQGLISNIEESEANDRKSGESERRDKSESESTDSVQAADETDPTGTLASKVTASDTVVESPSNREASDNPSAMDESVPLNTTDDAVVLSESETQGSDGDSCRPPVSDGAAIIDSGQELSESSDTNHQNVSGSSNQDGHSNAVDYSQNITSDSSAMYRCPRCEFKLPMSESSFFTGDVCPQCRVGYLEDASGSEL